MYYRIAFSVSLVFFLLICLPPRPTLFPYTTLFRSPGGRCGLARPPHPSLQIRPGPARHLARRDQGGSRRRADARSEEHTSELQSPCNLVCRLLLEKKKRTQKSRAQIHGERSATRNK